MFIPSGPSAWPIAGPGRAAQDGTRRRTLLTRAMVGWLIDWLVGVVRLVDCLCCEVCV